MIKIKEVVVNVKQLEKLEEIANMNLKVINKAVKFGIKKFKDKANAKIDQCYQMIEAKEEECMDLQDNVENLRETLLKSQENRTELLKEHSALKRKYEEKCSEVTELKFSIAAYQGENEDLERMLTNRNWLIAGIIVIGTLVSVYFNL